VLVRQRQEIQALPRELSDSTKLAGEERILDWEGALNARDTGGLPTADGRRIRPGALARSDVLTRLTPSGRAALIGHGIRTIVDVRTSEELLRDVDYPFRDAPAPGDPAYVNVSFVSELTDEQLALVAATQSTAWHLGELNRMDIDLHRPGVAKIAAAVADAQPGGVLIHCHAGKDRTGMSVGILLSLAGVADDVVADDYTLTMLAYEKLIDEWIATVDEEDRERMRQLARPTREAMLEMLQHVEKTYGSVEQYLLGAGVTKNQVARIRERLVEPASPR
jgi:protein tyrosine/serine phosphatase